MTQKVSNIINHFWLDLDASSSMAGYTDTLVRVVDELISNMAQKSTELEQETRITINTFESPGNRKCLVWDKDVLRMPTIRGLYKAYGWTALIQCVDISLNEMGEIPTRYGDHSFVGYVVTDGYENSSPNKYVLLNRVPKLPENWTLAGLVPDNAGRDQLVAYGFPRNNVETWDTTTVRGVEEVIQRIGSSASSFMEARTTGVRGVSAASGTSLFQLKPTSVAEIQSKLEVLDPTKFSLYSVYTKERIDEFVGRYTGKPYARGEAYYELNVAALKAAKKRKEKIQGYKKIAILVLKTGKLYAGAEARNLLGLGTQDAEVAPEQYPDYKIFVQSTADNRVLWPNTQVLVMTDYALSRIG